jgi:Tfp pilus assembly protein PilF
MKDQLSANGAEQSAKAFEEVIRRAPTYAPAYAGLANTMATFPFLRKVSPQETLQKAAETARHAIQLDPSLAEAHSALAHAQFNLWNWREAESEFRIALNLDPDSATTLQLFAISLATEARFEEALSRAEAAAKLAPTSGLMTYTIALIHFHAGHFDQAIEAGKRTLDIDRGFAQSHHIISRAYAMKGMLPKALEEQAEWLNHGAGRNGNLWSAHLQALNGNKSAALQILKQWDEGNSNNASPPLAYPVTLLACGQIDRGLAALRQLVQGHVTAAIWLRATPELNRWKNDPRYVSAVALLDNPPKAAVASVPAAIALSTR